MIPNIQNIKFPDDIILLSSISTDEYPNFGLIFVPKKFFSHSVCICSHSLSLNTIKNFDIELIVGGMSPIC